MTYSDRRAHKGLSTARVKAVIGGMSTKLMTQKNVKPSTVKRLLEEQFKKI